jgi:SAM-dependent methyltransferase
MKQVDDQAARERAFYEVEHNWRNFGFSEDLAGKLRQLRELIPAGVGTICDLGCGNGLLTNRLARDFSLVGIDWSLTALSDVTAPRVCACAGHLPLRAGACDLLLSSELLEHLTDELFPLAIAEIRRLRPRHLLLSVPNHENIHINEVRCRSCGMVFNASHHYRSFTPESLAREFPDYHRVATRVAGPLRRAYPLWLLRVRQTVAGRYFQVPASRKVVCPRCGNHSFPGRPHNPISFLCDGLNRLASRRHPYWLYLLLSRED